MLNGSITLQDHLEIDGHIGYQHGDEGDGEGNAVQHRLWRVALSEKDGQIINFFARNSLVGDYYYD